MIPKLLNEIPPSVDGPRDLPDLRLWMMDQWKPGGMYDVMHQLYLRARPPLPGELYEGMSPRFDTRALPRAELFYVTADMCEIIRHAVETLPSTTLTPTLLPATIGMLELEQPWTGQDGVRPDQQLQVQSIIWGPLDLINEPGEPHIGISMYGPDIAEPQYRVPFGRTDWRVGSDTEEPTTDELLGDDLRIGSMAEDRRWFAAFCLLAGQTNLTTMTRADIPRPHRRRSQRRSLPADVVLIDVRHRRPSSSGDEHREVEWSHRWLVSPHWRQQAYGPGRTLRRPVFVAEFIKGPDDKPLRVKDTVKVVRP